MKPADLDPHFFIHSVILLNNDTFSLLDWLQILAQNYNASLKLSKT